ncbi:MAG: hypothetical protein ACLS48_01290 [[Eubacterium] siraeum]
MLDDSTDDIDTILARAETCIDIANAVRMGILFITILIRLTVKTAYLLERYPQLWQTEVRCLFSA